MPTPIPVFRSAFELPLDRPVFVYGAGGAGRALAAYLSRAERPAHAFVDSRRAGTEAGLPILSSDELRRRSEARPVVLIASFDRIRIGRFLRSIDGVTPIDAYALARDLALESRRMAELIGPEGMDLVVSDG